MPLFFMISGFLYANKRFALKFSDFLKLIKDKTFRLLVPFVFFALFWLLPLRISINYPNYQNKSVFEIIFFQILSLKDVGHLWFLPSLFLMFVLTFCIVKIWKKLSKGIFLFDILLVVILIGISYLSGYISNEFIRQTSYFYCFFMFGYFINIYNDIIEKIYIRGKYLVIILTVVLFVVANSFRPLIWIVNPLLFIVLLRELNFYFPLLDKISFNSFGIYLFYSPLCYITFTFAANIKPIFMFGINFLFFGTLSAILAILIRKIGLGVIIGEKKNTSNIDIFSNKKNNENKQKYHY